MKHEEMSDISTILVEPTDERPSVVRRVSTQKKPVVIVLPENANRVFQRPGDFGELKRLKQRLGTSITLVIQGNDRLKVWARRQGLTVYPSTEALAHSLSQRDTEPLHLRSLAAVGTLNTEQVGTSTRRRRSLITEPLDARQQQAILQSAKPKDRMMLILVALLLLGILGGIGFGYLLALSHPAEFFSYQTQIVGWVW